MKNLIVHFCIGVAILSTCLDTGVLAQYSGLPIIRADSGNDNEDLGILLTVLLLASKGRGCGCGCGCCCGGQNNVIPYPIPIPTNNPIINTYTGGCGSSGGGTEGGEEVDVKVVDGNYNVDANSNAAVAQAGAASAAAAGADSS